MTITVSSCRWRIELNGEETALDLADEMAKAADQFKSQGAKRVYIDFEEADDSIIIGF